MNKLSFFALLALFILLTTVRADPDPAPNWRDTVGQEWMKEVEKRIERVSRDYARFGDAKDYVYDRLEDEVVFAIAQRHSVSPSEVREAFKNRDIKPLRDVEARSGTWIIRDGQPKGDAGVGSRRLTDEERARREAKEEELTNSQHPLGAMEINPENPEADPKPAHADPDGNDREVVEEGGTVAMDGGDESVDAAEETASERRGEDEEVGAVADGKVEMPHNVLGLPAMKLKWATLEGVQDWWERKPREARGYLLLSLYVLHHMPVVGEETKACSDCDGEGTLRTNVQRKVYCERCHGVGYDLTLKFY